MPILPKLHYLDLTVNPFLLSVFIWFLVRFCLLVCMVLSYCPKFYMDIGKRISTAWLLCRENMHMILSDS